MTDSESVPLAQDPALAIVKSVIGVDADTTPPFAVDRAGDVVSYSIVVTNTGNQTLTGVSVSDPRLANLDCNAGTAGNQTSGFTLAPGAVADLHRAATRSLQADIDNNGGGDGDIDNTATADSNQTTPVTDSESVPLTQSPALNVVKTVTSSGPYDSVGDVITYSITVTNTGNQTLTGVTVTDPGVGAVLGACTPAIPATLAPGASVVCAATHAVTQADIDAGSYTNVATGDSNETPPDTDDETVPVVKSPALNVVKAVTSSGPYDSVGDVDHLLDHGHEHGQSDVDGCDGDRSGCGCGAGCVYTGDSGQVGSGRVGGVRRHARGHPGRLERA